MTPCRSFSVYLLALAACASEASRQTFIAADSGGIRIVTNSASLWGAQQAWTVGSTPVLAIHGTRPDSTPQLEQVVGGFRRSDGIVVVGDRGSSSIKYFDADGRLVQTVGRKGKGPGEFEYLAWIKRCGADSVFAYDITNRHVTVFDPEGKNSRWFTMLTFEQGNPPFEVSCNRQGMMLMSGWGKLGQITEPVRRPVPVSLTRTDGSAGIQLGTFPGTEMAPRVGGGSPRRLGRWLRLGAGRTWFGSLRMRPARCGPTRRTEPFTCWCGRPPQNSG